MLKDFLLVIWVAVILPILESGLVLIVIGLTTFFMMLGPYLLCVAPLLAVCFLLNSLACVGKLVSLVLTAAVSIGLIVFFFLYFQIPLAFALFHGVSGEEAATGSTGYWYFDFLTNHFEWFLNLLDVTHFWPGGPGTGIFSGLLKAILIAPFTMLTLFLPSIFICGCIGLIIKCVASFFKD